MTENADGFPENLTLDNFVDEFDRWQHDVSPRLPVDVQEHTILRFADTVERLLMDDDDVAFVQRFAHLPAIYRRLARSYRSADRTEPDDGQQPRG